MNVKFPEDEIQNIVSDYVIRNNMTDNHSQIVSEMTVKLNQILMTSSCGVFASLFQMHYMQTGGQNFNADEVNTELDNYKAYAIRMLEIAFNEVKESIFKALDEMNKAVLASKAGADETKH